MALRRSKDSKMLVLAGGDYGKKTTAFFCSECGYESAKCLDSVPAAGMEYLCGRTCNKDGQGSAYHEYKEAFLLKDISTKEEARMTTGFGNSTGYWARNRSWFSYPDWRRSGIGKSTILLQVCKNLSDQGRKVLYISGEESLKQIKIRADRIGQFNDNIRLFCETDLELIEQTLRMRSRRCSH